MIRAQFDKNGKLLNVTQTKFLRAVAAGDSERVRDLYNAGLKNARDPYEGDTALIIAAREGHMDVLRFLLHKKADIDAKNDRGSTALLEAIKMKRMDCVIKLLEAQAETNVMTLFGLSPLWMAAVHKDAGLLKLLLDHGARPSNQNNPWIAASTGDRPCIDVLLAAKVSLSLTTPEGNQPLHLAAANGHMAILRKLAAAGAPLEYKNKRGETPADIARREGQTEAANFLQEEYRRRSTAFHTGAAKPIKTLKPLQFKKPS